MSRRTLDAVALWLAVVAATLMLGGAVVVLAATGRLALPPLAMGLLMAMLAVGARTRRRAAVPPPA